jgi:small-conductance mechanosensitive channel
MEKLTLPIILTLILLTGASCSSDENSRVAELATRQLERQAEQNQRMAELQQEVASGSRELVEADARSRQEMVTLQREMQTERNEIGHQRDQLEAERRDIADSRHRDPIIAAAITRVAMVVVSLLPLLICWLLLSQKIEPADEQQMTELLLEDLVSTEPRLVPPAKTDPDKPRLPDFPQQPDLPHPTERSE